MCHVPTEILILALLGLTAAISDSAFSNSVIWIHCSSLFSFKQPCNHTRLCNFVCTFASAKSGARTHALRPPLFLCQTKLCLEASSLE